MKPNTMATSAQPQIKPSTTMITPKQPPNTTTTDAKSSYKLRYVDCVKHFHRLDHLDWPYSTI